MAISPHDAVRRIAREDLRASDPFRPEFAESRLAARRFHQSDPESFLTQVRTRLDVADVPTRLRVIRTAEHLGIVPEIREELLDMLTAERAPSNEHQRLRATIVRALGSLVDADALDVVERMTGDDDARVQANAIDALVLGAAMRQRPESVHARLVELKEDAPHRVRGATVRGLAALASRSRVARSEALERLDSLRRDPRPEHALAGAWAASRSRIYFDPGAIGPVADEGANP